MNDCDKYNDLIEKYLDGIITDVEMSNLQEHVEKCSSCRIEFNHSNLLKNVVKQAFSSQTSAEQAGSSLVTRLSSESVRRLHSNLTSIIITFTRSAAAAVVLLTAGVLLGFALDKVDKPVESTLNAEVPIHVGEIEGTVLVKHEGSDFWEALETDSKIRLGDTFHSAAKSNCILVLGPKSTLELDQNSMLVLKTYNGVTDFNLEHGELNAALESPHGPFFISTPHGRVEALGTEFTVKVTDE